MAGARLPPLGTGRCDGSWRAIASLALGAVALTVVVVVAVARLLVPDMPWAAAIALGAIVAPRTRRLRQRW